MSTYRIAVIVGSLRAASYNGRLARALEKLMPADFSFDYVQIGDLPLYNQDDETQLPAQVVRLKQHVDAAQGLLFVTPEYNRSIPGVLKNAIDWGSRPYGKSCWNGKPSGVVGASPGQIGTAIAQQHLRTILAAQGSPALTTPEVFLRVSEDLIDLEGNITMPATQVFLQSWVDRYVAWIRKAS